MDLNERIKQVSDAIVDELVRHGILTTYANEYADKHVPFMIITGTYKGNCFSDLKNIIPQGEQGERLWPDIVEIVKPFVLTFAERVRFELEREDFDLSKEDAKDLKEDLLALEEMESICPGNKECYVTDEQKELIQVLTEGLDPEKFDLDVKPYVTKEEIDQFRVLGKKFGLDEELIARHIEQVTFGTPTSYVQRIISRQNIIDQRRSRGLFAINSIRSRGNFKVKERD